MQLTKHLAALFVAGSSPTDNSKLFPPHPTNDHVPGIDVPTSSIPGINRRRACAAPIAIVASILTGAGGTPFPASATTTTVDTTTKPNSKTPAKKATAPSSRTANFPRKQPGLIIGDLTKDVVCEVFVDFACPYSRKTFATLSNTMTAAYTEKMAFVFHNVLQPWHHQSLWLHESSFAVKLLYPGAELAYWTSLFEDAPQWYDKEVYDWTRTEFYGRIASFAADVVVERGEGGRDDASAIRSRILQYLVPPLQRGGNFPTEAVALLGAAPDDDENALFPMTRQAVKFQRRRGVHVTPTVFVNGIEQTQISSGWSTEEWRRFLDAALS